MNLRVRHILLAAMIWCALAWLAILTGWAASLPEWFPLASFLMTLVLAANWSIEGDGEPPP